MSVAWVEATAHAGSTTRGALFWKAENSGIFSDGFESGNASSWSTQVGGGQ